MRSVFRGGVARKIRRTVACGIRPQEIAVAVVVVVVAATAAADFFVTPVSR